MASYAQPHGQVARVLAQSREAQMQRRRVFAAYLAFAQSDHGQVILDDLVQDVLLRANASPEDEGERRLVLKMLKCIAEAPEMLRQESGNGV